MFSVVLVHHHLTTDPSKDDRFTFVFEGDSQPYVGQVVICDTRRGDAIGEIAGVYSSEEALWAINNADRPLKACKPAPKWATNLVRRLQMVTGSFMAFRVADPEFGRPRPVGYQPRPVEEGYRQPRH